MKEKGFGVDPSHEITEAYRKVSETAITKAVESYAVVPEKAEEPEVKTGFEQSITGQLSDIGFKTTSVTKASFSMIGKHGKDILLTGLKQQQAPYGEGALPKWMWLPRCHASDARRLRSVR